MLWRAIALFEYRQIAATTGQRLLPLAVCVLLVVVQAFAASRVGALSAAVLLPVNIGLALLLIHPFIWEADVRDGTLALYRSRGVSLSGLALLKMLMVLLGYGAPLALALPALGILLGQSSPALYGSAAVVLGCLPPLLVTIAALSLGTTASVLAPLLLLPLALPPLLAGVGILSGDPFAPWLGGGLCVFLWSLCPWLSGAALRAV